MGANGGKWGKIGGNRGWELSQIHHGKCMKISQHERKMGGEKWEENGAFGDHFSIFPTSNSPIFPAAHCPPLDILNKNLVAGDLSPGESRHSLAVSRNPEAADPAHSPVGNVLLTVGRSPRAAVPDSCETTPEHRHAHVMLWGCCRTVRARCGPFPVFLGILPGGEAHNKPLWRVFPNACGWSPKAFG